MVIGEFRSARDVVYTFEDDTPIPMLRVVYLDIDAAGNIADEETKTLHIKKSNEADYAFFSNLKKGERFQAHYGTIKGICRAEKIELNLFN